MGQLCNLSVNIMSGLGPICVSNVLYKFRTKIGPKQTQNVHVYYHSTNSNMDAFFVYLATNITKPCPGIRWDQSDTYVPKTSSLKYVGHF